MGSMYQAGRVLVRDAPEGTAAARILEVRSNILFCFFALVMIFLFAIFIIFELAHYLCVAG
jgi:hypothetical protein